MLKEYAEKYYFEQNYNCAETVLHAANECYGLGLDEKAMRLLAGCGGGIQIGSVCGALLGAVSVLSMKYVDTKAHESEDIKPAVSILTDKFREKLGSLLCRDIKPQQFQADGSRCMLTVLAACDAIEEVLDSYLPGKGQ